MTCLHIELLIHYYVTPEPFPRSGAPAVSDYRRGLIKAGLLQDADTRGGYRTTNKGEQLIRVWEAMGSLVLNAK